MTRAAGRQGGRAAHQLAHCTHPLPAIVLFLAALPSCRLAAQQQPHPGKPIYDRWCAGCHGETGAGDGEAAPHMLPRPRDFTKGVYQIRTTASGALPTDADLRRVIDEGMPGTAMPEWRTRLTQGERDDVVAYLKTFSRFFQGPAPEVLNLGRAPSGGEEAIAQGREAFQKLECFKCHGEAGRGDGTSAPTLTDDLDFPIRAADLTESWNFNGGSTVEAIYARLRTGLDGTPMPSFSDAVESGVITDEQLWRVSQYVRSLSEEPPRVREVIRAARTTGIPADPADSVWFQVEAFYIPLVGQIVRAPRWFTPSVDGIWVRALHDGQRLAIRISWSDPSRSPDSTWQEWLNRVAATVARDDTTAAPPAPPVHGPDRLVVQFPRQVEEDLDPPYFLGGSPRRPVYDWRWSSNPDRVEEGTGMGLDRFAVSAGPTQVAHAARFAGGEWQVQFTRALVPADTAAAPAFAPGYAIPIAFRAADGSNGEDAVGGSISAWYAIYLDVPTPGRVYVQPVVAAMLTAGLGFFVVFRAQRREQRAAGPYSEES